MAQIIPQPFHAHVLDHLTKQPIDFFMREGEVSLGIELIYVVNERGMRTCNEKLAKFRRVAS